ncbi:MAG: response regulator receiver protein [Sedimenticola sp.]|nr:MAG: response regulator receiver protein [Sedimenticola sp.]
MLELDFVLRGFLDNHYPTLSADDQALFVKILDYQDQLLLDWVMGHVVPSDAAIRRLVALMQNG